MYSSCYFFAPSDDNDGNSCEFCHVTAGGRSVGRKFGDDVVGEKTGVEIFCVR